MGPILPSGAGRRGGALKARAHHRLLLRSSPSAPFLASTVIGALIGIQKGREVEIVNSYELAMEKPSSGMDVDSEQPGGSGFEGKTVDWAFFEERSGNCKHSRPRVLGEVWACARGGTRGRKGRGVRAHTFLPSLLPLLLRRCPTVKQVFPTLDFLGWYSVGVDPSSLDLSLHSQVRTVAFSSASASASTSTSHSVSSTLPLVPVHHQKRHSAFPPTLSHPSSRLLRSNRRVRSATHHLRDGSSRRSHRRWRGRGGRRSCRRSWIFVPEDELED